MSFNTEIKSELVLHNNTSYCCNLAELSALCLLDGKLSPGNGTFSISFYGASIAKRAVKLFTQVFDVHPSLEIITDRTLGRSHRYELSLANNYWQQLNELGVVDDSLNLVSAVPERIISKKCCRNSYLRGVFLAKGYIMDPIKGHHFEVVSSHSETIDFVERLLNKTGITPKRDTRKNRSRLYIKDTEEMIKLMASIGCHNVILKLENIRIVKEIKSHANRLANCDSANMNKLAKASIEQLQHIMIIDKTIGLDRLPKALNDICQARLDNPGISIKELGEKMSPSLTKSAVYHRFRRIAKLAKQALN